MTDDEELEPLMTNAELARLLRIQPRTLDQWRCRGRGPKWIKFDGRVVRYRRTDVIAWLQAHTETGQDGEARKC